MLRPSTIWRTWDEPDRQIAVVEHADRGLYVVFPIEWAAKHGQTLMIARAKERITEVEAKSAGRKLVSGSVLLAFSEHEEQPPEHTLAPEVSRRLM